MMMAIHATNVDDIGDEYGDVCADQRRFIFRLGKNITSKSWMVNASQCDESEWVWCTGKINLNLSLIKA